MSGSGGSGQGGPGPTPPHPVQPSPTPPAPAAPGPAQPKASKAGRNLPAAISVGVALGALVIGTLLFAPKWWVVLVAVAIGLAVWELFKRLRQEGILLPLPPLLIGGPATVLSTWWFGVNGALTGYAVTAVLSMIWCLLRAGLKGKPVNYVRDVSIAVFVATWVVLLGALAALLVLTEKKEAPVFLLMICVACSDIGGYAAGVLFGKHPMVPQISPKKSWEGFAGSITAGVVGGALVTHFLLEEPALIGAALGAVLVVFATLGDLIESQFKRDLGIKDMGTLLPGHGGLMDRLDSLLMAVPVVWVVVNLVGYEVVV